MEIRIHITKTKFYALLALFGLISLCLIAFAVAPIGSATHPTLFTDILRSKSGSTVSVLDNLGIGTTTPAARLTIRQATDSQSGGTSGFRLENTAGTAISQLLTGADSNAYWFSGTGFSYLMIQQSTGNLGIGTTAPSQKLDVTGNVNAQGYCINGNCRAGITNCQVISTTGTSQAVVTCPAGEIASGGGCRPDNLISKIMTVCPSSGAPGCIASGTPTGWYCNVGEATGITVYATCCK